MAKKPEQAGPPAGASFVAILPCGSNSACASPPEHGCQSISRRLASCTATCTAATSSRYSRSWSCNDAPRRGVSLRIRFLVRSKPQTRLAHDGTSQHRPAELARKRCLVFVEAPKATTAHADADVELPGLPRGAAQIIENPPHATVVWLADRLKVPVTGIQQLAIRAPRRFCEVEIDQLEAVIDFLEEKGATTAEIFKMADKFPYIFMCEVESMRATCDILAMGGVEGDSLVTAIRRSPFVFKYRASTLLETATFLLKLGLPRPVLEQLFRRQPETLGMLPGTLEAKLAFFRSFLSEGELAAMLSEVPTLLGMNIENGFLPKMRFLRSIGLDEAGVVKVLTQSTMLKLNLEYNIVPKYRYLTQPDCMGRDSDAIVKMPTYFQRSLTRRIIPRGEFAALHGRRDLSMSTMFTSKDREFAERVIGVPEDEYAAFVAALDIRAVLRRFCDPDQAQAVLRLAREGTSQPPPIGEARRRAQRIVAAAHQLQR